MTAGVVLTAGLWVVGVTTGVGVVGVTAGVGMTAGVWVVVGSVGVKAGVGFVGLTTGVWVSTADLRVVVTGAVQVNVVVVTAGLGAVATAGV